jgi:2-keto-3-deoxy-L-rhamnonate aldolase RhmA
VKSRDPSTTEALAAGGLDFVIADLEHSSLSVHDVEAIARAGAAWNLPVLARVPPAGLGLVGALLDAGAAGIQVSDVTSTELARQAEAAAHYPPRGQRSLSLATRAGSFGMTSAAEHVATSDRETVLIGQIESASGLAALSDIIEARAFSALFIGPSDLSLSLGHPGDLGHPAVADALAKTAATILDSGTPLGIACPTTAVAAGWAARGATLLAISSDVGLLASAAAAIRRP